MTLEEYKKQSKEIYEAARNFSGTTQEEAVEFFDKIAQKYPEVTQFNDEAIKCKNIDGFKQLADKFGLAFSSEDSAKKLFSILADSKKQMEKVVKSHENGAELSDDELDSVTGGVDKIVATAAGTTVAAGTGGGVVAGAALGALAGGPIGAVVGCVAGGLLGAFTGVGLGISAGLTARDIADLF